MSGDRKLFILVGLGFALLLGAWTTFFTLASRHRMADVPLAHKNPPARASTP